MLTPEERVRQFLLQKMVEDLGFPRGLISVEKKVGLRRYDIVCFTKEVKALLLVECKAGPLDASAIRQVFGYNDWLMAPFLAVTNGRHLSTYWHGKEGVESIPFLPTFKELYDISKRC